MQIIIEYDSTWRNSFLDGSNNQPLPKGGRKFIASMTNLRNAENYIERGITKDTVMGVLNRLIGEQAKLYQARERENYYFKEIEAQLKESDIVDISEISQEVVFIRNKNNSTSQNDFTGLIKSDHPTFNSHYSNEFWGVLWLDLEQLIQFMFDNQFSVLKHIEKINVNPELVLEKSLEIQSLKSVDTSSINQSVFNFLEDKFPNQVYGDKEKIKLESLYAASLYLQLERLEQKFNKPIACNFWRGEKLVFGFSKKGFNGSRDFMRNFITGGQKIIYGGAYTTRQGNKLNKASGQLIINLDLSEEKAKDLYNKINNAGVSAFYLGKKGLAYVKKITIGEEDAILC